MTTLAPKDESRVLITYGWNRISYVVNRSLRRLGYETFVADRDWLTMNRLSKYTYKNLRYPSFYKSPDRFIEWVLNTCKMNGIRYWIPCHEEIFIAAKYKAKLLENEVHVLVTSLENLKKTHLKDQSAYLAETLGINVPSWIKPQSMAEAESFYLNNDGNVLLKYIQSNSGKGVLYIRKVEDLSRFSSQIGQWILQKYITGVGVGVSCCYGKNHQCMTLFSHKRILEKSASGGTSVIRESMHFPEIEKAAMKILDELGWEGPAMVEFKFNSETGEWWFIEVNPRLWGSISLPYHCGVDFPLTIIEELKGATSKRQFDYPENVKSTWAVGLIIRIANDIRQGKFNFGYLKFGKTKFDILSLDDPGAVIGELVYYGKKCLSTLSFNPKHESVFDIEML